MACNYIEKIKDYLEEKLTSQEMQIIESHLAGCEECKEELDRLLNNELAIKPELLEVEDDILISKIKARIKGIRRITFYGMLGFIIGIFSRYYTQDDFLVTKAIMALPYKLAEFALGIFFSANVLPFGQRMDYPYQGGMGFFPFHPALDFLATSLTPAIIASFIAVVIGYLLSDKRIFQRKKIINFLLVWLLVVLVWVGSLYGIYDYTLGKMDDLRGIKAMTVYKAEKNSTSWLIRIDQDALRDEKYARLLDVISRAEKDGENSYPQNKNGFEMFVDFVGGGRIPIYLDQESGEIIMQNGNSYQVSPDELEFVKEMLGGKKND